MPEQRIGVSIVDGGEGELEDALARFDTERRRAGIGEALAVALAAVFIVGGAIAAQSRWLGSRPMEVRFTAAGRAAVLEFFKRGYTECLAAHGSHPLAYVQGTAAESACAPVLGTIAATCLVLRSTDGRVATPRAAACLSATRARRRGCALTPVRRDSRPTSVAG